MFTITKPKRPIRWPAAANNIRLRTMSREERIAQITREMLKHDAVKHNDTLRALAFEAMALAELNRRELGEAKPGGNAEPPEPWQAPAVLESP